MAHTPSPWKISNDGMSVYYVNPAIEDGSAPDDLDDPSHDSIVATATPLNDCDSGIPDDDRIDNIRLMASAPDLLIKCETAAAMLAIVARSHREHRRFKQALAIEGFIQTMQYVIREASGVDIERPDDGVTIWLWAEHTTQAGQICTDEDLIAEESADVTCWQAESAPALLDYARRVLNGTVVKMDSAPRDLFRRRCAASIIRQLECDATPTS